MIGAWATRALLIAVAAAVLSWPAAYNGFPFVFSDTASYLEAAFGLVPSLDRAPFYGLFLLPLRAGAAPLTVVLLQGAVAGYVILLLCRGFRPRSVVPRFAIVVSLMAATTALPWTTSQLMPDFLTGLLVVGFATLGVFGDRIGRTDRIALTVLLALAVASHHSHLPLAAGLLAVVTAGGLIGAAFDRGRFGRALWWRRSWACLAGALIAASGACVVYNQAVHGRPTLNPMSGTFLLARLIADGSATAWLDRRCPETDFVLCADLALLRGPPADPKLYDRSDPLESYHNWLLWNVRSPLRTAPATVSEQAFRREAQAIVAGTLRDLWQRQLRASLGNTLALLDRFDTLDGNCPNRCGYVATLIGRHLPAASDAYRNSRQNRETLPLGTLRTLHRDVVVISLVLSLVLAARAVGRRDWSTVGLFAMIVVGLVANAAVLGSLSGPYDRYQARVVWLLPLFAVLATIDAVRPVAPDPSPDGCVSP